MARELGRVGGLLHEAEGELDGPPEAVDVHGGVGAGVRPRRRVRAVLAVVVAGALVTEPKGVRGVRTR